MQFLADICPQMVTAQSCSPVGCSRTIAGKSHTSMAMTTKQTESYLTVPHSLSSYPAAGDIIPPIVPTSTTILHHSEKSTGLTSNAFPVTTSISGLTQTVLF